MPKSSQELLPSKFLEIRVHDLSILPGLTGLCAGYEKGEWRSSQLSEHLMEWLPEFALNWSERKSINHANAVRLIKKSAQNIYKTKKFQNRGEFGELLLHVAIRQSFNTLPAVSKIYYKSAHNDTVKGFDAVHVVVNDKDMELWIGEAKFYKNIDNAIRKVVKEINDHTQDDYLRDEFTLITGKIDDKWPQSNKLKKLLDKNTSLDEVFDRACIPVLLTYDSETINSFTSVSTSYINAFESEIQANYLKFRNAGLPSNIRIHLFLLPLKNKKELVVLLDEALRNWQKI
jgi:hypothetical protein